MSRHEDDIIERLDRIACALEMIAHCVAEDGILKMRDVDRAKVYSEHLGNKLKDDKCDEPGCVNGYINRPMSEPNNPHAMCNACKGTGRKTRQ